MSDSFEPDKRRAMTPARKRRIWEAWEGKCWFCRQDVPMEGEQVRYDHRVPLWIKGSDADHDIAPIHALTCDKGKTAKDLRDIAKIKRIIKKQTEEKPPSRLKGRGFERPKGGYRWPSRKMGSRVDKR